MRWRIVIYSPPNYLHASAFQEVAETVLFSIRQLGYPCDLVYNALLPGAINLVFGSNIMDFETARQLPDDTILFNLEQIDQASPFLKKALPELIGRLETWDYSARNIDSIRRLFPARELHHVPIGYVPQLSSIVSVTEPDIDVLFYGSLTQRRNELLDALEARGLKVVRAFNTYGAERDALIARAKLVLNIHSFKVKVLEIVRISFLLANGKAVVSECDAETELQEGIAQAVALAPYAQLVETCVKLVADDDARLALQQRGLDWIRARPAARYLAPQLERLARARAGARPPAVLPRILHFERPLVRAPHIVYLYDASAHEVDVPYDFHRPLPLGAVLQSERFGPLQLLPDGFDEIVIGDPLSWVTDLPRFMLDCALLLRAGGRLSIQAPYVHSARAWEDPRTVRTFRLSTWQMFQDAHIRLGWPGVALEPSGVQAKLSALGSSLQEQGATLDDLLATPLAVDTLIVNFTKRALRPLPV